MRLIPDTTKLILVTGVSGAGLSTALKILEDLGVKVVDNIPLALIDQLVALEVETAGQQLAVGLDVRTTGFTPQAVNRLVTNLRHKFAGRCSIVFVSAAHRDLMRRFNATRRQHPLGGEMALADAITADITRMAELESLADVQIDSSGLKPADMRQRLLAALGVSKPALTPVTLISFSYRHGLPQDADIVIDMRFADNPHWIEELRPKTGRDGEIDAYMKQDEAAQKVITDVKDILTVMLARMAAEGRPQLTIGFGCTGGRHRSVWASETIAAWLRAQAHEVDVMHRELDSSD
jgi:RNase adapter protein RapZ